MMVLRPRQGNLRQVFRLFSLVQGLEPHTSSFSLYTTKILIGITRQLYDQPSKSNKLAVFEKSIICCHTAMKIKSASLFISEKIWARLIPVLKMMVTKKKIDFLGFSIHHQSTDYSFVCIEVLRPCQQLRSCRAGQLPINTVPGKA